MTAPGERSASEDRGTTARTPVLHYVPPAGWMNDPNGLIDWNGRHHLFFQHNPTSLRQTHIRWGHASSIDLIRWETLRDVLLPGVPDTAYDKDGCYSGCAVAEDGGVTVLYTGVQGDMQLPCLARSDSADLATFTKSAANPIITDRPLPDAVAFRDHSLLRDGDLWRHLIGGGTKRLGGAVFGYIGQSLDQWKFDQVILDSTRCKIPGTIWECPDLFRVDDTSVLIVSPLNTTLDFSAAPPTVWYATGTLPSGRFEPSHAEILDHGDRFYAPQSYWTADGRRIMFGWLRTDQDPTVNQHETRGAMSLPRELVLHGQRLYQRPARELMSARAPAPVARRALDAPSTTIGIDPPLEAAEIEITGNAPDIRAIELIGSDGNRFSFDVDRIPADSDGPDGQATTLYFDAGIIEIFRDGRTASTTDLSLDRLASVTIHRSPQCTGARVALWPIVV